MIFRVDVGCVGSGDGNGGVGISGGIGDWRDVGCGLFVPFLSC